MSKQLNKLERDKCSLAFEDHKQKIAIALAEQGEGKRIPEFLSRSVNYTDFEAGWAAALAWNRRAEPERKVEPVAEVVTIGGYPDDSEHTVKWLVKFSQIKAGDKLYLTPVSQWQPIESAPKGHELFLLYEPHEAGGFQFVGARNIDGDWVNNLDGERQTPSHWMPLPAAPKEQSE